MVTVQSYPALIVLSFLTLSCRGAQESNQIGPRGILHKAETIQNIGERKGPLAASERVRKETAERFDKTRLLSSRKIVTDEDARMLIPPNHIQKYENNGFTIAEVPPRIEFGIVPSEPLFFPEPDPGKRIGLWSNWSQANYYEPTGKFYSSVGDHIGYNAHMYIVEYDPATKIVRCLPEINKVLGRTKDEYGEGKIHGWLDFYGGPFLWFCTYWCTYPEPTEEDFATGYDGGHIMSLDVLTGDIIDYGVPLVRASWPYHRVDTRRGMLYAVGMFSEFLAWDIREQKTKWAGYLPDGMQWWVRAFLIDEETGMVYTSNTDSSDAEHHMLKYDPFKNRFFKLGCHMPANKITGAIDDMRANTEDRGKDGLFYGITYSGEFFSFNPETETIEDLGLNWPGEQRYTASMARSPGGRYIYYFPGAHGKGFLDGSPLVQYDTRTHIKRVLAFMYPYYYEKYGYTPGGTFSIKLDTKGERLFVLWNGAFVDIEEQIRQDHIDVFGTNSVMLIHIPEEMRRE